MTQAQAVKQTIRNLGGIATLKEIYKHVQEIDGCTWNTKTPDATIRRIVQQDKDIIRLKAGYYMLVEYRDKMVKEQVGDQLSIEMLIQRLVSIPSSESRYQLYVQLNTLFQETIWDNYKGNVYELIKNGDTTAVHNFFVTVQPGGTYNNIHDCSNPTIQ